MKLFTFFIISLILIQAFTEAFSVENEADSLARMDEAALNKKYHPHKINCSYACARRCRKASRNKICKRACKTCCERCNCVPPGTYGNTAQCPCYASLKTHGNKPKCP
ncbi:hypothetical protein LguiB_018151 [Lonicera macranthoides]